MNTDDIKLEEIVDKLGDSTYLRKFIHEAGTGNTAKINMTRVASNIFVARTLRKALADLEDVALSPVGALLYFDLNINCYSFQVEVSGIHIAGKPVYISGLIFKYRELEA